MLLRTTSSPQDAFSNAPQSLTLVDLLLFVVRPVVPSGLHPLLLPPMLSVALLAFGLPPGHHLLIGQSEHVPTLLLLLSVLLRNVPNGHTAIRQQRCTYNLLTDALVLAS
jgi:hypothetical protein